MKKILILIISGIITFSFLGCSSDKGSNKKEDNTADIVNANSEAVQEDYEEDSKQPQDPQPDCEEPPKSDLNVDIDLTAMSSTFIYSEVYNMMMSPEEYVGETVKMEGNCGVYIDEQTGKKYYACIVQDATQCCSQGLEFILDENKYSESDYPNEGDEITVTGEFSTYVENGGTYLTMKNAVMN